MHVQAITVVAAATSLMIQRLGEARPLTCRERRLRSGITVLRGASRALGWCGATDMQARQAVARAAH